MNQAKAVQFWKSVLDHKSCSCKHQDTCFWSFLKNIKRSFLVGYTMRVSLNTLFALLRLRKSLQNPVPTLYKILLCDGDFRLPAFITVMNSLTGLFQCILRQMRGKNDMITSFFSAFMASYIGLYLENPSNWYTWRMYLGGRAIDMIFTALANRGIFKKKAIHYSYAFAICSTLIAKGYFHEPRIVEGEVFKLYSGFSNLNQEEKTWHFCQVLADERILMKSLNKPFDGLSVNGDV